MNEDWLADIAFRGLLYAVREEIIELKSYYSERSVPLAIYTSLANLEELLNITEDEYLSSEQSIIEDENNE